MSIESIGGKEPMDSKNKCKYIPATNISKECTGTGLECCVSQSGWVAGGGDANVQMSIDQPDHQLCPDSITLINQRSLSVKMGDHPGTSNGDMPTNNICCWKLQTITYNVNRQKPTRESVQHWLDSECPAADGFAIICVAMQEVPNSEVFKATRAQDTWSEQITFWMAAHKFSLANKLCLASNMLLVYISLDILNLLDRIDTRWCRDSLFGSVGFKGTISTLVVFRHSDIAFVFITSHFFADEKYAQQRIRQFHKSLNCTFPEQKFVKKFVIWQGDLNSRTEGFEHSAQFIRRLNRINEGEDGGREELAELVESHDQLAKCKRKREAFTDFEEAPIEFKPTYRILAGSGAYDPLRTPSWCDRILFNGNTEELKLTKYSSCRSITLSDHFPVSAQFLFAPNGTTDNTDQFNQNWPCQVEHIPTWEELIPLVCRIVMPDDFWTNFCSGLDWVGVYPASVDMVPRPLDWIYVFTCPFDDQRRLVVEFGPMASDTYRIGYFCSRKKCLQALSNAFFVRKVANYDNQN